MKTFTFALILALSAPAAFAQSVTPREDEELLNALMDNASCQMNCVGAYFDCRGAGTSGGLLSGGRKGLSLGLRNCRGKLNSCSQACDEQLDARLGELGRE